MRNDIVLAANILDELGKVLLSLSRNDSLDMFIELSLCSPLLDHGERGVTFTLVLQNLVKLATGSIHSIYDGDCNYVTISVKFCSGSGGLGSTRQVSVRDAKVGHRPDYP
jgi:hypothetical protein